ncbi:MAG: tagatose 1,6-diphosphate aldolase [Chloroflexota bacterium]
MRRLTTGKTRGLQQLANSYGIFAMCAMDHRDSLKHMLSGKGPEIATYQAMVDFKMDLCHILAPSASAVLLDPVYGAKQAVSSWTLPGDKGLLVSLEDTEYYSTNEGRITKLLPDWGVAEVKRLGASAAKLLLYYRPDLLAVASKQLDTVRKLADDCEQEELAFLVEPKAYAVDDRENNPSEFATIRPDLVIETARQITALPIDVLKAEFPADMEFEKDEGRLLYLCQQLDRASQVPWVILSAGVSFEVFARQVEIACKTGASGFLAGRALWQEATSASSREERQRFLQNTVAQRLDRLTDIANTYGTPWYLKTTSGSTQSSLATVA